MNERTFLREVAGHYRRRGASVEGEGFEPGFQWSSKEDKRNWAHKGRKKGK